jgi:hypothetical protein
VKLSHRCFFGVIGMHGHCISVVNHVIHIYSSYIFDLSSLALFGKCDLQT